MKKLLRTSLLGAAAILVLTGAAAKADTFTFGTIDLIYSDFTGSGQLFGTVTITQLGATGAHFVYDVAPNMVINNGGPHNPLAFNLSTGSIVNSSIKDLATPTPHDISSTYSGGGAVTQQPFGNFANSIGSTCDPGASGSFPCNLQGLQFDVSGYTSIFSTPFNLANIGLNGTAQIFFAGDVSVVAPDGSGTGNIAGGPDPVPAPIVGAGLPGLILAALGMFGLSRRRRRA
jgi:hypothetical protein